MIELTAGQPAPDFAIPDQTGAIVSLSDFRGKTVVLFFYPEDDTPGCTLEACGLRDNYAAIQAKGAVVLGLSANNAESHRNFQAKYQLPFSLLADTDKTVIMAYGAWGTKTLHGNPVEGILRHTYIIGPTGLITKIFRTVTTETHGVDIVGYL